LLAAAALVLAASVNALQPEECSSDQRKFTINPDADAFIGEQYFYFFSILTWPKFEEDLIRSCICARSFGLHIASNLPN
jgi:hypothetical protein